MGFLLGSKQPQQAPATPTTPQVTPTPATTQPPEVSQAYASAVALIESSGNPYAQALGSTALGLYQFTSGTWLSVMQQAPQLSLTLAGRTDPAEATRAFDWLTEQNDQVFYTRTGRFPTDPERYLCWFLGVGRAADVCSVPASTPLTEALGSAYEGVRAANGFVTSLSTTGDLVNWSANRLASVGECQGA